MFRAKALAVHEGRMPHTLPQTVAQLLEPGQIAGQVDGQRHVLLWRSAASSCRPRLHNWLQPARPKADFVLTSVIVGTPIQNASRLVVCPLQGTGSRAKSICW